MTDGWSDTRREIAYTEARAVLEAQNATMGDIDDKAMRTVRLNAVLLGLLATGVQFVPELFSTVLLQVAVVCLVGSTVCGIVTYNESDLYVGPRGEYLEALGAATFADEPWDVDLITALSGMVSKNRSEIHRTEKWLTATQATLVGGLAAAVTGVAIYR